MASVLLHAIGTMGDIHPMLGLAIELKRRGHRVRFASLEHFRAKVESNGIPFERVGPDSNPEDPELVRMIFEQRNGLRNLIENVLFGHLRSGYDEMVRLARDADVVVSGDNCYVPQLLFEKLGVPWASMTIVPFKFFSVHQPPVWPELPQMRHLFRLGPRFNRWVIEIGRRASAGWCHEMHAFRRDLGLPPVVNPLFDSHISPLLHLALFSRHAFAPQPDWPAQTHVAGFSFFDRDVAEALPDEVEAFLRDGPPPVVFTLASARIMLPRAFFDESLPAARDVGVRAILVAGHNEDLYRRLPRAHDVLVTRYVRYSQLFPRCAAVVASAGVGTVSQAFGAGVPIVGLAEAQDSFDLGFRVEALGTGVSLPFKRYRRRTASRALDRVLCDGQMKRRAVELAARIRPENGLVSASEALERFLASRSASRTAQASTGRDSSRSNRGVNA